MPDNAASATVPFRRVTRQPTVDASLRLPAARSATGRCSSATGILSIASIATRSSSASCLSRARSQRVTSVPRSPSTTSSRSRAAASSRPSTASTPTAGSRSRPTRCRPSWRDQAPLPRPRVGHTRAARPAGARAAHRAGRRAISPRDLGRQPSVDDVARGHRHRAPTMCSRRCRPAARTARPRSTRRASPTTTTGARWATPRHRRPRLRGRRAPRRSAGAHALAHRSASATIVRLRFER